MTNKPLAETKRDQKELDRIAAYLRTEPTYRDDCAAADLLESQQKEIAELRGNQRYDYGQATAINIGLQHIDELKRQLAYARNRICEIETKRDDEYETVCQMNDTAREALREIVARLESASAEVDCFNVHQSFDLARAALDYIEDVTTGEEE